MLMSIRIRSSVMIRTISYVQKADPVLDQDPIKPNVPDIDMTGSLYASTSYGTLLPRRPGFEIFFYCCGLATLFDADPDPTGCFDADPYPGHSPNLAKRIISEA